MILTNEQTKLIIKKLENYGFKILSFGDSFENPFEEIDEEYFNEKVNESLEDYN